MPKHAIFTSKVIISIKHSRNTGCSPPTQWQKIPFSLYDSKSRKLLMEVGLVVTIYLIMKGPLNNQQYPASTIVCGPSVAVFNFSCIHCLDYCEDTRVFGAKRISFSCCSVTSQLIKWCFNMCFPCRCHTIQLYSKIANALSLIWNAKWSLRNHPDQSNYPQDTCTW